jgi:hypothetical protein
VSCYVHCGVFCASGSPEPLEDFTIAVTVFDRQHDFDPQTDPRNWRDTQLAWSKATRVSKEIPAAGDERLMKIIGGTSM